MSLWNAPSVADQRGQPRGHLGDGDGDQQEYDDAVEKGHIGLEHVYLVDLGVKSSRITTISFGEENPVVRGRNEAAWAKNRRDDFVLR